MKIFSRAFVASTCFVFLSSLYAVQDNPLLGSWSRARESCERPAFVFARSEAIKNNDADGAERTSRFRYPAYTVSDGQVVVDFKENHGVGRAESKTVLKFVFLDRDSARIVLKDGRKIQLNRCN